MHGVQARRHRVVGAGGFHSSEVQSVPDEVGQLGDEQVERQLTLRNQAFGNESGGEVSDDHDDSKFQPASASARWAIHLAHRYVPTGTN